MLRPSHETEPVEAAELNELFPELASGAKGVGELADALRVERRR